MEHHPAISGCIYRNVCPKVFDRCVKEPALKSVADGHSVSCFLYHDHELIDNSIAPEILSPQMR